MNLIKKGLSVCMAIVIGASSAVYAYADTNVREVPCGVIHGDDSEYKAYLKSLSKDEIKKINEKNARIKAIENQIIKEKSFRAYGESPKISIPGTFTIYQQEKSNYCVPACVKSIMQYINGSSDSQRNIAKCLNTTSTGTNYVFVPRYLNEYQDKCFYNLDSQPSQTKMLSSFYNAIVYDTSPCMLSIKVDDGDNWDYETNGHSLVVNAIRKNKSKVQFADPIYGTKGAESVPAFYEKKASVVYNVRDDIIC